MIKVKPTTKEQLIYFLINNLSLGTYDRKFLTNIESMCLLKKKPVTTNQSELFDKIIKRYSRQLAKQELILEEILSLPWETQPIASSPQFTETFLLLVDDELILRSPYKSNFVKDFRKLDVFGKWITEDKVWRIPANSYSLGKVVACIESHYNKINYCESIQKMLDDIKSYNNMIWEPTYKYLNGNFYVVSTNRHLEEAISDIPMNSDLNTICKLVSSGIKIDSTVIDKLQEQYTSDQIDFAINYRTKAELDDLTLIDLLLSLNPDHVIIADHLAVNRFFLIQVKEKLKEKSIEVTSNLFPTQMDKSKLVVVIQSNSSFDSARQHMIHVDKIIQIVNSKPINIK